MKVVEAQKHFMTFTEALRMNKPYSYSQPNQTPLAYRPRQAAEKLGISLSSLDRLTKRGDIPVSRVGGFRLYPHEALVKWLNSKVNN